ncbi:NAD-dependent deacylase [Palleronia sp. LCG004]|uniref:NAD-dependent deacylase n=1 Tax=Palleronia sp. LCG004 TaxID=3079304 RepID=UPI0029426C0D|nr:NAD-dependent deacylase [Palleronia sp. LCG004]WOI56953.1 NAD-dependent deacylase [Palleronia sp. LCG004]
MERIVILSGAGLSAESGLGTFRDEGGIWSRYDLSEVATPEGFARDPAQVHEFYNARRSNAALAVPNPAHKALVRLQSSRDVFLVTQNVDALLDRAGARNVLHMHGRLDRATCAACGETWDAPDVMHPEDPCPGCGTCATRPDVVWFGEMPKGLDLIEERLGDATLFVAIGTSGTVYPAAGFVDIARSAGVPTLELNLEPSGGVFDAGRYGRASRIVPDWVDEVLSRIR